MRGDVVASGKSLELKAIVAPEPVVVQRYVGAPRSVRRNRKLLAGWKRSFVTNDPYENPGRDQRPGRKLKGDQ